MTHDDAKKALLSVLENIQTVSGLDCPPLQGTDIPTKVLPKFDSTIWPVATTLVARKLGVSIPNNVHIFGGEHGAPLLSVDQIASAICKQSKPLPAAA
ncbi:MAG: hypothetical protein K1X51_03975 [Rhodospirillaceae bacterium]|nr:hypothetical protein [Rhodospirillaceae bacterium]